VNADASLYMVVEPIRSWIPMANASEFIHKPDFNTVFDCLLPSFFFCCYYVCMYCDVECVMFL